MGRSRYRMNPETRIAVLELRQTVIAFHRPFERSWRNAELIMKLRHAVERKLHSQDLQLFFFERLGNLPDDFFRVVPVCGHIDLPHLVLSNELAADCAKIGTQKRLAP